MICLEQIGPAVKLGGKTIKHIDLKYDVSEQVFENMRDAKKSIDEEFSKSNTW